MTEIRQPFGRKPILPELDRDGRQTTSPVGARIWYFDSSGNEVKALSEDTGHPLMVLYGWDGSAVARFAVETTGEQKVSNYGWNGAALTKILLETTGEQRMVLCGKDEAGNIDALLTDEHKVLWTRSYEDSIIAPPVLLPAADGILWNPGGTLTELYEVDFLVVNVAGAATGPISIGVDINRAGSLSAVEYWMYQENLPWPGTSGWRGSARQGFLCRGADSIRGLNGAGANLATVHFRIRRIDTNL
jgi:hypothetical protein